MTYAQVLLGAALLPLTLIAYHLSSSRRPRLTDPDAIPSALIPSYTTHARLLPVPTKHAFSYPLLYLGIDVDALEAAQLDIGALVNYGGSPWTKVLGLRSLNYLTPGPGSMREKLDALLLETGVSNDAIGRAWMVSMPSFLGFEGINPLTVWYVYHKQSKELSCVILEVHNTFGEKHAYVLTTASEHQVEPNAGYHNAWIFPRTFHVSPFNSRNGYYRLDVIDPLRSLTPNGTPEMKVFLRLLTPDKEVKLTALVASHPTYQAVPLELGNQLAIIAAIARWPFTLFISTPRILYQAYKLHYEKKLAMFPRPEPRAEGQDGVWNPPQNFRDGLGVAIGWQAVSSSETWLRKIIVRWMQARANETGMGIKVVFSDRREDVDILPSGKRVLTIETSDPTFFTTLVTAPSPRHLQLLFPRTLTAISNPELLTEFFSLKHDGEGRIARSIRDAQMSYFRWAVSHSNVAPMPDLVNFPSKHFTAHSVFSTYDRFWVLFMIYSAHLVGWLEETIMHLIGARFVDGAAPWQIWERALHAEHRQEREAADWVDLASQAKAEKEDWVDLGSIQY